MNAEEYLRAGRLDEALASARESVRSSPADSRPRILLFQLLCVMGQWDKALIQLNVLNDMDADCMLLANIFMPVIHCEALREQVFAGHRSPIIFGKPEEWVGMLVQANQLVAEGRFSAARELRERAFEAAPANGGKINEQDFEWIADADSRLGPLVEVIIEGRYYWVPFFRIKSIHIEPPQDLRDLVWTAAQFVWVNGGEAPGFIPTRYPETEAASDNSLRLARRTEWIEKEGGSFLGLGQRMFATDQSEVPLLEIRKIELLQSEVGAGAAPSA